MHTALHELDPTFRRVTLQNERMKAVARDLGYHRFPVGTSSGRSTLVKHNPSSTHIPSS
jgi:hypothetical protein